MSRVEYRCTCGTIKADRGINDWVLGTSLTHLKVQVKQMHYVFMPNNKSTKSKNSGHKGQSPAPVNDLLPAMTPSPDSQSVGIDKENLSTGSMYCVSCWLLLLVLACGEAAAAAGAAADVASSSGTTGLTIHY